MNTKLISDICTVLSTMKADQKWTSAHDEAYLIGLGDLPDEAGLILRREVIRHWDWRPSVREMRTLWAQISQPKPLAADELVARLYGQRDKYGPYVVPDPEFPRLMKAGEPAWTDPNLRRLAAARGGWVAFCAEEANSTNAAQFLKLAAGILGGATDAAINALRLEYQAASPPSLSALPEPADVSVAQPTRHEAAQVMASIEARIRPLRMVETRSAVGSGP